MDAETRLNMGNNTKQQTALDFFFEFMSKNQYFIGNDLLEAYNEAKKMELKQFKEAHQQYLYSDFNTFEGWYNHKFGGQIDINDHNDSITHQKLIVTV